MSLCAGLATIPPPTLGSLGSLYVTPQLHMPVFAHKTSQPHKIFSTQASIESNVRELKEAGIAAYTIYMLRKNVYANIQTTNDYIVQRRFFSYSFHTHEKNLRFGCFWFVFFCRNSFILIKKLKSVAFGFSSIFSVLFFPVRPCRKYADYAIMKSGRLQVNCPYAMYQNLFLRKIIFTEKS